MGQDTGPRAGALERADDMQQVGIVALLGRRRTEVAEALEEILERVEPGAPALVGASRIPRICAMTRLTSAGVRN